MGQLVYVNNVSLDGYCEDQHGGHQFGPIDPVLFRVYITLIASTPTLLYGRRLYTSMAVWETDPALARQSALTAEFATVWRAARKIVYSSTLATPCTGRTHIERTFSPDAVRALKSTTQGDMIIGGADLASQALAAGLVDECRLFVWPVVLGRGKPALQVNDRLDLELIDQQVFDNGVLMLRYRCAGR